MKIQAKLPSGTPWLVLCSLLSAFTLAFLIFHSFLLALIVAAIAGVLPGIVRKQKVEKERIEIGRAHV